jgi:anti-anti-sigma factor
MAELKVLETGEPVTRIVLVGRLDTQGVDAIEVAFTGQTSARRRPAVVDMSEVTFLASLGMGMLIRAAKSLRRHEAGMVLLAPSEPVEKALRLAQIHEVIPIVHGLEDAIRTLESAS